MSDDRERAALFGKAVMADLDDEIEAAEKLLPAWFVPRMMSDTWFFAFIMTNGTIVHFDTILGVTQAADGSIWIDVDLLPPGQHPPQMPASDRDFKAPTTSRTQASIHASHIMFAIETADT